MPLFPDASPLRPGTLVAGKYRLVRRIGQGAMGVVWAACHGTTSRMVAVKLVVHPDPELYARLMREARACGRLSHRNVVEVFDAGETERGEPYLVMPLLDGETLTELLKRKRSLPPHEAAQIARDIARGLAAAHALGVVHRDLKPSNVFLQNDPDEPNAVVKLLDFGVSKMVSTGHGFKTATGIIVGSPGYMSPEQVRSPSDVDHRTDLWSLGVVLHQMLAGVIPFRCKSIEAMLVEILRGDIPSVSQVVRNLDPRLADVVAWCLQRDRDRRVRSAAEVAGWLDAVVVQGGVPAQQATGAISPAATPSWDPALHEQTTLPLQRHGAEHPTVYREGARPIAQRAAPPEVRPAPPDIAVLPCPPARAPAAEPSTRSHPGVRAAVVLGSIAGLLLGVVIVVYSLLDSDAAPAPLPRAGDHSGAAAP